MPRTARTAVGGICYHVVNRGNARGEVFHKPEDYIEVGGGTSCSMTLWTTELPCKYGRRGGCQTPSPYGQRSQSEAALQVRLSSSNESFQGSTHESALYRQAFSVGKLPQGFCFIRM